MERASGPAEGATRGDGAAPQEKVDALLAQMQDEDVLYALAVGACCGVTAVGTGHLFGSGRRSQAERATRSPGRLDRLLQRLWR